MSRNKNETAYAHGMRNELVERDWQEITLDETNELLLHYPQLSTARYLSWHSPRPFSSAAIAVTENEPLFVKRHHYTVRNREGLLEEHRFMTYLRGNGLAVNEVITDPAGESAHSLGDWTYEIYRLASGIDLYRDAVSWTPFLYSSHAYAAGQALARLHKAAEGYSAPSRPLRPLVSSFTIFASDTPAQRLSTFISERSALREYLQNRSWNEDIFGLLAPFHSRLLPFMDKLAPIWTHNDLHASNMLWSSTGEEAAVETILDFGLSDCTTAVYDLATTIERNVIEWLRMENAAEDIVHYDQLEALLEGYESIRPLNSCESKALAVILPLVHAEFALSEIDYFAGIVYSRENADLAYETFLLGHARWFYGTQGARLLNYLEHRANRQ